MAEARLVSLTAREAASLRNFLSTKVTEKGGHTSDAGLQEAKVQTYAQFFAEAKGESLFV